MDYIEIDKIEYKQRKEKISTTNAYYRVFAKRKTFFFIEKNSKIY